MDAVILAGGDNRRFRSPKALAEIKGRKIIEGTSELLKQHFNSVFLSTNTPELFFYLGLPMIGDIVEQRGPVAGIYSSLYSTGAQELFVVACDMPFIRGDVISLIVNAYREHEVVLPRYAGKPEALLGIYPCSVLPVLRDRLARGRLSLWDLDSDLSPQYVSEEEVADVDPEGRSFVNVNTLAEYRDLMANV